MSKYSSDPTVANTYIQARQWATTHQDLNKARDFIREMRENSYCDYLGSNCGLVLKYVLGVMQGSTDATFFASRDRVALDTGIHEKTVEYNIKKLIKLGIFNVQPFINYRNPNQVRKCLTINPKFRKTFLKTHGTEPKILSKKQLPQATRVHKQGIESIRKALASSDVAKLSTSDRAVGLLLGVWGVRCMVYPGDGKELIRGVSELYKSLDIFSKILFLKKHIDELGGGFAIKVPAKHMILDCDTKESFEISFMENYLGGMLVKSYRGG